MSEEEIEEACQRVALRIAEKLMASGMLGVLEPWEQRTLAAAYLHLRKEEGK